VPDPERVAVYGSSYGGYAALCGAAFTPELYRCAIAHAAPCNLRTFIQSTPAYGGVNAARLLRRIGDPARHADLLWSRSPMSRLHQIKIPLLIAHGARDPRVSIGEPEQLVAALRACERFLSEHLGGRYEG